MLKDLGCIKVVLGSCPDCFYKKQCESYLPKSFIDHVFKMGDCVSLIGSGNIFKKEEEVWETCTRENTSAGDIVIGNKTGDKYLVKYVHDGYDKILLDNYITMADIDGFKVKVG